MPKAFPANSLKAARLALVGQSEGWVAPFARAVYTAQFRDQANIADDAVLTAALEKAGQDAARAITAAGGQDVKDRLKENTNLAKSLGIFGAPSFTAADDELFWGDDRLEQAVAWAKRG
jgi:2-hydroxychromene-2-carboxylate isomerase